MMNRFKLLFIVIAMFGLQNRGYSQQDSVFKINLAPDTNYTLSVGKMQCVFFKRPTVDVKRITTYDKVFTGTINEKKPFTLYLKFHKYSDANLYIYSAKGWYYFDNLKIKTPVVGIYAGELTLYSFADTARADTLLNFLYQIGNFWDEITMYQQMQGYKEKIGISQEGTYWINQGDTAMPHVRGADFSLINTKEYLLFDSVNAFDLGCFGPHVSGFKLEAASHDATKILLSYEYASRAYVLGQCGAASETGFMQLTFSDTKELLSFEDVPTHSCNNSFGIENERKIDEWTTEYEVYSYYSNKTTLITVDLKNITITQREK